MAAFWFYLILLPGCSLASEVVQFHKISVHPYRADTITGSFSFDLGPKVTTDVITGAIDFGLDTSIPGAPGISFRVQIPGPLRNLFGIEGFQVANFEVGATFPPTQEFIPSMIRISGAVQIASLNDVKGS